MSRCKKGYYYCYTNKKCKPISKGMRVTSKYFGGNKDPEEVGIDQPLEASDEKSISEKLDGKSAKDPGYSLRDWFKGGGWVQAGGKYDGKPCAKQPGQKTKPFCRDPDDRAVMSKDERNIRAAKKRAEDPNPDRKGKAKMVRQKESNQYSDWREDLKEFSLPGTGRVLQPYSDNKYDSKIKSFKSQQKFLGIPIPGTQRPERQVSNSDLQRFNLQPNRPYNIKNVGKYAPTYVASPKTSTSTANNTSSSSPAITSTNNTRLRQAQQDARSIGRATGTSGLMRSVNQSANRAQKYSDTLRQTMKRTGVGGAGADQNMSLRGVPMRNSYEPEGKIIEGYVSVEDGVMYLEGNQGPSTPVRIYTFPDGSKKVQPYVGGGGAVPRKGTASKKTKPTTQMSGYESEGELVDEGKKDACYKKVKSRYSVWPSAYASGALVKCRKVGAANWGNKSEEWVVNTAAEYLFNEGLNEDGIEIFIEEIGLESFVEFVYDIAEDEYLTEARAAKRRKGGKSYEQVKAEIDAREKAKAEKKVEKTSTKSAIKTAKKQQPKKRPVLDAIARQVTAGMKRHQAAMAAARETGKTISKAAQVGAKGAQEFGKGFKSGVETAGKVAKVTKKAVSENYQFSDWREDFKAMEYEFIDIIEAEPLVTEASFEIKHTSADVRKAKKNEKIRKLAQQGSTEGERCAAASKAGTSLPSFKKEEVDKRRAPAELVARLSARREGEMAQDGPNKPAYDAKQRILAKTKAKRKAKRMGEEVESIDELKCWKGYKRKKGAVPGAKGSCVKESEVTEAKDETEIGFTGKKIPKKKRSPKKQHEFEKKRRKAGFDSRGPRYSNDVNPYYNPRTRLEEKEDNISGKNLKTLAGKAVKRIDVDVDGDVDPNDKVEKKTGNYGEELPTPFGKFRTGDSKKVKVKKEEVSNWRDELDEDWQKVNKSDKTDGMSPKAVAAYRRENPGSKLKTAVTGDPKPGSKDAKRRKNYCDRSKGQQDMHNIDCSKTPDKPICKARRRWKC